MTWSLVQSNDNGQTNSSTTLALAYPGSVTSGNRSIVWLYLYGSGRTLSSVTDNLGNQGASAGVYDVLITQPDVFNGHLYLCSAPITSGGACTVTATASGGTAYMTMAVFEYSGLSSTTGSGALDTSAGLNGTVATSMSSGTTGATTAANQLAIAALGDSNLAPPEPSSPGAPWTEIAKFLATGSALPLIVDDMTPASGATVSATWTFGTNDSGNGFAAAVAVFKLAGAGPATLPPGPRRLGFAARERGLWSLGLPQGWRRQREGLLIPQAA